MTDAALTLPEPGREPEPGPPRRGWLRTLWRLAFLSFAVVTVLLALAIGLFRILVPMVPNFHERIETAAGSALGVTVTFEKLDVRWRWRGPELVFEGAHVFDTERDTVLLEARGGHVNLNVGAFISQRSVVPDFVVLRGLDIEVFRNESGEFSVLGRRARRGEGAPISGSRKWPLPTGLYVLREARVRYSRPDAPVVVVPRVDVDVEVTTQRLRVDGDLVPPDGMGSALEVTAELDRGTEASDALDWTVYVAGSELELGAVNRMAGTAVLPIVSGSGDLVAWAEFSGLSIRNASLDVDARNVTLARGGEPYERMQGRIELDRTALGWRLRTRDGYIERGGVAWPALNATLTYDNGPNDARRYQVDVPFARLDDIWPLAELMPRGRLREALALHRPTGDLYDLNAVIELAPDSVPDVAVQGRFERVGWDSDQRVPGVAGLTGRVQSDGAGGRLTLDTDSVTVTAPHLFDQALRAWRLSGAASWQREGDGWSVQSDNVLLATEDFDALAKVQVQWAPGDSPQLDVDANIGDLDIVAGLNYLPVGVMKPRLVTWLNDALKAGTVRAATLAFHGPLDRFPFDDAVSKENKHQFEAVLDVEDLSMAFSKTWPAATQVDSRVRFEGRALNATVSDAAFGKARIDSGEVTIDDLKNAVLELQVGSKAPIEDVRDYIVTTPVGDKYAALFRDLSPRGPARTSVGISMPVKAWRTIDYQVDIDAEGAVLGYRDWPVDLEDIRGTVMVSRDGIRAPAMTAALLSRPVDLSLDTVPLSINGDKTRQVRVMANGRTDASMFAQRIHPPLVDMFSGTADWQATIAFPPASDPDAMPTTVTIDSDLRGLAVSVPPPVQKSAEQAQAFRATLEVEKDQPMRARLELKPTTDTDGEAISAALSVITSPNWQVERGEIVFNEGDAQLDSRDGLALRGRIAHLDVDTWRAHLAQKQSGPSDVLRTADLTFEQISALGQSFGAGRLTLDRNVREWLVEVETPDASGAVFLPRDWSSFREPVIANMQRLRWRPAGEDSGGSDPRNMPALRLDVQDFWYDDMNFGQLSAQVSRIEDGLSIDSVSTRGRGFEGQANGAWRYAGGEPSEFKLTIDSTDVRTTMEALGSVGAIDADEATFTMDLHWDDELDSGFVRDVYGEVSIAVGDGQLLSVDPKAGRVFGLISLAALPRRLSLDFRDVFQKGLAFDAIEGNFSVRNGNAFTDNLTLRGPAAQVAVVGRAGIASRDYDQTASVYANFGSSLPIAGALAGGPAVGAALLIFSEVFKDPLKQIGRVDYGITGSWDDPAIARLNVSSGSGNGSGNGAGSAPEPLADPLIEPAAEPPVDPQTDSPAEEPAGQQPSEPLAEPILAPETAPSSPPANGG